MFTDAQPQIPEIVPKNLSKVVLNWGQELEKHERLMGNFKTLEPLTYDLDTTFHKLFGKSSKNAVLGRIRNRKSQILAQSLGEKHASALLRPANDGDASQSIEGQDLLVDFG